jgi:hypothetical protein
MGHYQSWAIFDVVWIRPQSESQKADTLGSPNNLPAELRGDSFAA